MRVCVQHRVSEWRLRCDAARSSDVRKRNLEAIVQFCDAMSIASYDAVGTGGGGSPSAPSKEPSVKRGGVVVGTIHQAKGLEYDRVYLPGLSDGAMPLLPRGLQPNSLELVEHFEEERRILYVAMTRARSSLVLSWPCARRLVRARQRALHCVRGLEGALWREAARMLQLHAAAAGL